MLPGEQADDRSSKPDPSARRQVPPMSHLLVLRAGQVFDGERSRGEARVLIQDGKITDLDTSWAQPPEGAEVVDFGSDACLLPGLIDAVRALRAGVTTATSQPKRCRARAVRPDPGNRIYFRAFGTSIEGRRRRLHRTDDLCGQQLSHSESWPGKYSGGPGPRSPGGCARSPGSTGTRWRKNCSTTPPAAHVRRPRLDYESHAVGLDRNELGALLVAAGPGPAAEHALISSLALTRLGGWRPAAR